jgi:sarcosine oxidase
MKRREFLSALLGSMFLPYFPLRLKSKFVYDVAVIGLGGMGSAAVYHLSKRGVNVCGIEQFGLAHQEGGSHGETRIIRKAYFEHPDYIPLLHRTYDLWHALEKETGRRLFVQNGLIMAGPLSDPNIKGTLQCYEQYADLPREILSFESAQQRFPQFVFREGDTVIYDPIGGSLLVEEAIKTFIAEAQHAGATLFFNEPTLSWKTHRNGFEIRTTRQTIYAKHLILTTGAWLKPLMAELHVPIDIWRKCLFWYRSTSLAEARHLSEHDFSNAVMPNFYIATPNGAFYGLAGASARGVKLGEHVRHDSVPTPQATKRPIDANDESPFLGFIQNVFSCTRPERTAAATCMYDVSPDGNFIIDEHPNYKGLFFAGGFSGHGYKFAPLIGEVLTDLCLDGQTKHPINFLRLQRFEKQTLEK